MIKFDNPRAFAPMAEPVKWRQDAAPHRSAMMRAVVTRGVVESQSAGPSVARITGDVWTVHVRIGEALVDGICVGDTIERVGIGAEVLTVQQIVKDDAGWWIACTADERSPL